MVVCDTLLPATRDGNAGTYVTVEEERIILGRVPEAGIIPGLLNQYRVRQGGRWEPVATEMGRSSKWQDCDTQITAEDVDEDEEEEAMAAFTRQIAYLNKLIADILARRAARRETSDPCLDLVSADRLPL